MTLIKISVLSLLLLTACGKRGTIEPPVGSDGQYPRTYPAE
jgi:hypothetical protein